MSDYDAGETLIATQIKALTNFSASNVSQGNWLILNNGKSAHYAILRPGPFQHNQRGFGGSYETRWTTVCELWVIFGTDHAASLTALKDRRQEIIDRFDAYRKAGDTSGKIRDVVARSGGEPEEMTPRNNNGPVFIRQLINIEWQEEYDVTLQE